MPGDAPAGACWPTGSHAKSREVYRRGAVWAAEIPDVGRKPVVLVSSRLVTLTLSPIVARVASVARERALPTTVALDDGEVDGLPRSSFVLGHDLYTITPDALRDHLGWVRPERMSDVETAILAALGLART